MQKAFIFSLTPRTAAVEAIRMKYEKFWVYGNYYTKQAAVKHKSVVYFLLKCIRATFFSYKIIFIY